MLTSADEAQHTQKQALAANQALSTITDVLTSIDERNRVIAAAAEEQAQVAREVGCNLVRIHDLSSHTSTGTQ